MSSIIQAKVDDKSKIYTAQKRGRGRNIKAPPVPAKKAKVAQEDTQEISKTGSTKTRKSKDDPKITKAQIKAGDKPNKQVKDKKKTKSTAKCQ